MSTPNNRDFLLLKAYESGIREPKELAVFMGQMQIESGGFKSMNENLHYSGAGLMKNFNGRNGMDTQAEADAIAAGGQEAVANAIYGGKWGAKNLGNTQEGDGWNFHGRGYVQLTGRSNYAAAGKELGLDFTANPGLAADRDTAAKVAVHYWQSRVVPHGHQHDVKGSTHDINGGEKHLPERRAAAAQWEKMLTPEVMERLAHGEVKLPKSVGGHDPMADGKLKLNERGEAVQHMQESLKALGYRDAKGNELNPDGHFGKKSEDALKQFQRDQGIKDDGVAGPATLEKLKEAVKQHAQAPGQAPQHAPQHAEPSRAPSLADPANRDHGMYQQAMDGLQKLGPNGGFKNHQEMERAAATLTYESRVHGMNKIDHVVPNADRSGFFAVQGGLNDPAHQRVLTDKQQAIGHSVEQTSAQLRQDVPQLQQPQQQPAQEERQQQPRTMVA
ncbi:MULTISPECIES: XVIPCD domain-containing protein [unclassified Lysobacter]|uniref:XVIPCD domain-containing protein n=1 Tax=unclassified Lysobacter TaxID=2635362 RepID=UPI001BE80DE1|nr:MULTISPECIES: XVIPCD domain-containing protein [unclassified Lysobacter]MBT2746776.1 peptidoglycan-binding protein [Lysobacter sp. ISL-42]MBT2751825.1 peptidoglycan-binding protein [Lysobacter sp. ISL-50]MBT2778177.1 peptidoglycan-binding protein [Lysobacter sp. ISL-54]MBT2781818.1 peptidoglycan-binding protein [Lysobacter sp. ISL-52]